MSLSSALAKAWSWTLRAVATAIGAVLVAIGWSAAVVWRGLRWCARAVRFGWQDGLKPLRGRQNVKAG